MKKYNEEEQARLRHYIEPARKDGRALWAVVRLSDKKIVGRYSTRSLAFLVWKRFNAAPRRIAQPAPKPVIHRVVMPGMPECHKCKRLCSNKDDLYTHTCLVKKVVKLKPQASWLKKGWDWGIRGKKELKEVKRFFALRKGKAKKGKSTYWHKGRMPGSGWAGRGQR
jgi:hypothetical protein